MRISKKMMYGISLFGLVALVLLTAIFVFSKKVFFPAAWCCLSDLPLFP